MIRFCLFEILWQKRVQGNDEDSCEPANSEMTIGESHQRLILSLLSPVYLLFRQAQLKNHCGSDF